MSTQKTITLQPLASQKNLSISLFFKMEDGKVSSSVSTLFPIAKAPNTEINRSFNDQAEYLPIILVRKWERAIWPNKGLSSNAKEVLDYKGKSKLTQQ